MEHIKELEEIKEKLERIDGKLFDEHNFKNKKTNFRVYAQNKILSIILELKCLENGFMQETLTKPTKIL